METSLNYLFVFSGEEQVFYWNNINAAYKRQQLSAYSAVRVTWNAMRQSGKLYLDIATKLLHINKP